MTPEPKRRATQFPEASQKSGRRGRPRLWANAAEKHRAHRQRRAQKLALIEDLLDAVRNASLEDPQLKQAANHGEDADVLRALIAHYEARNWNLLRWQASQQAKSKQA